MSNIRFEPVRKARIDAGITVAVVAQAADKTGGWVGALERGLVTPSRADAERIAALFGVDVETLFSRIREEVPT